MLDGIPLDTDGRGIIDALSDTAAVPVPGFDKLRRIVFEDGDGPYVSTSVSQGRLIFSELGSEIRSLLSDSGSKQFANLMNEFQLVLLWLERLDDNNEFYFVVA